MDIWSLKIERQEARGFLTFFVYTRKNSQLSALNSKLFITFALAIGSHSTQGAMKRESGESPEQSRCCELSLWRAEQNATEVSFVLSV